MEIQSCTELLTIHGIEGKVMEGWTRMCRLHGAWWAGSVQGRSHSGSQATCLPFFHPHNTKMWLRYLLK